jgi:hypothetical protein
MYITGDGLIGNEQGFFFLCVVELGSVLGVVSNFLHFENSGSKKTFAINTSSPACPAHITNTLKLFVLCSLQGQR